MTRRPRSLRMSRLLPAVLVAALGVAGCSGGTVTSSAPLSPQLQAIGSGESGLLAPDDRPPAPALAGETLEGEPLDLADYEGKIVVLNFWASWCAPCRAEAKNLVAVAEATASEGVEFVGVNVKDDRESALAFERNQAVPYPSLHDQPGVLLTRFRHSVPQTPPTTLLIDREGRIAGRFIGGVTERELLVPVQTLARET